MTCLATTLPPITEKARTNLPPLVGKILEQLLLAGAFLALFGAAAAGTNQWTPTIAPGDGAYIGAVSVNPVVPTTVYGSVGEKVYYSINVGAEWKLSTYFDNTFNQTVAAVQADPVTPSRVYAGTSGGMLLSQDGGVNWWRNNLAPTITTSAPHLTGATITGATVLVTTGTCAGLTSATITQGTISTGTITGTISGGTVTSAWITGGTVSGHITGGGIVSSCTNDATTGNINGTTWQDVTISGVTVNPGTVWSPVIPDISTSVVPSTAFLNPSLTSIAITPSYPTTVFAGSSGGGVYSSTDNGYTWAPKITGLTNLNVTSLAIDPATITTIYAATGSGGVFRSANSGTLWTAINAGLSGNALRVNTVVIDPVTTTTIYIGTSGNGVYKSANSGTTWTQINSGLGNLNIKAIVIDPSDNTKLYAGTAGGGVYRSLDSGATWTEMNTGLTHKFITSLTIAPLTQQKLFAGTDSGLFDYEITNSPGLVVVPPTVNGVPGGVYFGAQAVGTISAIQQITLTNNGTLPLSFSVDVSGEFSPTTSAGPSTTYAVCGTTLAAGASCYFNVTFNPASYDSNPATAATNNAKSGQVVITSDAPVSPYYVTLKGTSAPAGTGSGTTAAPGVSLSPDKLVFATQSVDVESVRQTVTLTNIGTATLNISSKLADGDFYIDTSATTCGATLPSTSKCVIKVYFKPSGAGDLKGTLFLYSDATGSPHTVSLEGAGTSSSVAGGTSITLSPTKLEFPVQAVGVDSTVQTVTLTNTGTATLNFSTIFADGDFKFVALSSASHCEAPLAPGKQCTIGVKFAPTGGGDRKGSLYIYSDAAGSPATVDLSGAGTTSITLSPASLDFGSQANGQLGNSKSVTLTNTGPVPLNISATAIIGQSMYVATTTTTSSGSSSGYTTIVIDDFIVTENTCESVLAAGASCVIDVAFFPRRDTLTGGTYTDTKNTLAISDDAAGSPHKVLLTGRILPASAVTTGAASVSVVPSSLDFGAQQVSLASTARVVTLTNVGNGVLNISNIIADGDFSYTTSCGGLPVALASGKKCAISVTLTPTGTGDRGGKLLIYSDADGSPHSVTLTGSGSTTAASVALSIVPSSLDFSVVSVNTPSAPATVTITNKGNIAITFLDINWDGDFSQASSSTCGATPVSPGASCTFDIVFTPSAEGQATGTLTFSSDAATQPYTVALSGTGGDQMSFSSQSYGAPTGLTITAGLHVAKRDASKYGKVYLAALVGGTQLYFHNGYQWVVYNGDARGPYPSYSYGQLTSKNIPVISNTNVTSLSGTVIYLGYGVVGFVPTEEDMFSFNKYGQIYVIP